MTYDARSPSYKIVPHDKWGFAVRRTNPTRKSGGRVTLMRPVAVRLRAGQAPTVYGCSQDAADALGKTQRTIWGACNGQQKISGHVVSWANSMEALRGLERCTMGCTPDELAFSEQLARSNAAGLVVTKPKSKAKAPTKVKSITAAELFAKTPNFQQCNTYQKLRQFVGATSTAVGKTLFEIRSLFEANGCTEFEKWIDEKTDLTIDEANTCIEVYRQKAAAKTAADLKRKRERSAEEVRTQRDEKRKSILDECRAKRAKLDAAIGVLEMVEEKTNAGTLPPELAANISDVTEAFIAKEKMQ